MIEQPSPVPLYRQLYEILRARIDSGEIRPGHPIPSKRSLVEEFGVATNTAQHAIELLQADGLLITVKGKGLYVVPEDQRG